jgi:hypothetical protein
MEHFRTWGWFVALGFGAALGLAAEACGGEGSTVVPTGAGGSSSGGSTSASGGNDVGVGVSVGGNGTGGKDSCAQLTTDATLEDRPVDIIFVVGNNGSMAQEIAAVEQNINANFASVIEASGIDYRVIMVSRSGGHQFNVCVEAPLGGVPAGGCASLPGNAAPVNAAKFFHYSAIINASDSWCKILGTYDGTIPDEYELAPNGWSQWLRPGTAKVFVLLSDSSLKCNYPGGELDDGPQSPSSSDIPIAEAEALEFDAMLLGLSSEHFGTAADRLYFFHNIVGLQAKNANDPTDPWLPADPITLNKCSAPGGVNSVSPALGYQALSRLSNGLRFPICEFANFDVVFQKIAQGIITGAAIDCSFPIPDPGDGQTIDPATVEIAFTSNGNQDTFHQVSNLADCVSGAFYIESDVIHLCPETCDLVQVAPDANIEILFGCELDIPQ